MILVNPKTQKTEIANVKVIRELSPEMKFDYILVVMQSTQVEDVLPILARNGSNNIVFVVNTAMGYEGWARALGKERIMIGFPSAGGERKDGKVYYFVGRGTQRLFQTTTFGEYSGKKTERVKALINMFNQAKIPSVICSDMDAWQKTHVALVTNIANALYGFDCNNFELGKSYPDVKEMVLGIKEARQVLRKINISPTPQKLWWFDLPSPLLAVFFSMFMRSTLAETTMAKHCVVAKPEMIFLQEQFDQLIEKSGLDTPIIDKLKANLEFR